MRGNANELMASHADGFKRIGFLFWLLNAIEASIISNVTFFFVEKNMIDKTIILNRALFNHNVFKDLDSRREFFMQIVDMLNDVAIGKGIDFDLKKYKIFSKDIKKIQETRNKLAHNIVRFSKDDKKAWYTEKKKESTEEKEIDLEEEIKKATKIYSESSDLLENFVKDVNNILYKK